MQSKPLHQLARPTLEEWYSKPVVQVLKSSDPLDWEQIKLRVTYLHPAPEEQLTPQSEKYALIMILDGASHLKGRIGSKQVLDELILPGAIQLITPHLEGTSSWDSPSTAAFVEFPPQFIHLLADGLYRGDPCHLQLAPQMNFRDTFLRVLVETLCSELNNNNPFGTLYAESISQTIILHLLKTRSRLTTISHTGSHRLTVAQIRLMNDYIDTHLSEKITLSDLAVLLHISVSHFERIFRNTFGRPPYQYVIERRVEHVKDLLSRHHLSLHDVARICGFANQSHMTRHFTRLVGVTPARFARYIRR
jgi:AraC family transcriptional regulator